MPLKHATETLLVFVLGLLIVLMGVAVAFLPPLPQGIWLWLAAFVIAVGYPVALSPLLRSRRADYAFRLLQWFPLLLLAVRFGLDLLLSFLPDAHWLVRLYTWGWTLPGVVIGIALLVVFCLRVIRQRIPRMQLLAATLLPFLVLGVVGEQYGWTSGETVLGNAAHQESDSGANLLPSDDPSEESWRMQLRRRERRSQRIAQRLESGAITSGLNGIATTVMLAQASSASAASSSVRSSPPPRLPSSGIGMEGLLVLCAAAYCAVVHERAKRRVQ